MSQRIAVDAMGGDDAPRVVVEALSFLDPDLLSRVVLVGVEDRVKGAVGAELGCPIVHASEVVAMGEPASQAVRKKKHSSIAVGVELVKSGEAGAFVSAGNTGAVMAYALYGLGRLPGIHRPAIAALFPTVEHKPCLVADVGANVDCKPEQLLQFATMGSIYYREVIGVKSPRVGLLSIGSEDEKGNDLTQKTLPLLRESGLNVIGNVEGRDVVSGQVEVVVCDGFVGNIMLKFGESLAMMILGALAAQIERSEQNGQNGSLKESFARLLKRVDYSETGGAPLLGVNGVCIISHGGSTPKAIANAIRAADQALQHNVNRHIIAEIGAPVVG